MLLRVKVDATGPLLDWHDREAYVDAAMKFAFLDLQQVRDKYFTQGTVYSRLEWAKTSLSSITFTTDFSYTLKKSILEAVDHMQSQFIVQTFKVVKKKVVKELYGLKYMTPETETE